jgi:hypothetical protein
MFFTFPEDARWNAERQAVEFGVEIGEYSGMVTVPRRVFHRLLPEQPTPERCLEAYYLQRTRFERIAERKLRQRQLTDDGNVEISGRDLREGTGPRRGTLSSGRANKAGLVMLCLAMLLAACGGSLRGDASAGPNPGGGFYGAPNIDVGRINP